MTTPQILSDGARGKLMVDSVGGVIKKLIQEIYLK